MRSLSSYWISFIAILALAAAPAHADYHYVSHEGSNEWPYTSWETAAWLIQDAVDATDAGDSMFIGAGEWYETVNTWVHDSIGVIGMGMDSTLMYTDEYQTAALDLGTWCLVEGIKFRHDNNWRPLDTAVGVVTFVRNCKFVNSLRGVFFHSASTEITNCVFDSCGTAIVFPSPRGVSHLVSNNLVLNSYDDWAMVMNAPAIVQNNIILNLEGADVKAIHSGGGIYNLIVRNNIVANGAAGIGVESRGVYNNIAYNFPQIGVNCYGINAGNRFDIEPFWNNSITHCRTGIRVSDSCIINYSNLWNNVADYVWGGGAELMDSIGNIYENPMYMSYGDFHLQAFSPLVNAGDPDMLDPDGTRSDIGAYGGPYGEAYDYIDLPPAIPDSISGEVVGDTIILNWRYNTEADFSNYFLYRDTLSGFEPSIFNLIAEPETSYYADTDIIPGEGYYYRISALDNQGNISDYSEELEVTTTDVWNGLGPELPRITTIQSNYPNPFNSSTTIIYAVANLGPLPAEIEINIYDITGRKVRTLVREKKGVGMHRAVWDGRGGSGHDCPSGIYFARITQWGMKFLGKHQKLVLIR